jgi:hypothetical protein
MGIMQASSGRGSPENSSTSDLAKGKPKADAIFDGWLNHHLSRLYDPVIHEPIPADLLKLLKERLG